jgi:hypothetical protein
MSRQTELIFRRFRIRSMLALQAVNVVVVSAGSINEDILL